LISSFFLGVNSISTISVCDVQVLAVFLLLHTTKQRCLLCTRESRFCASPGPDIPNQQPQSRPPQRQHLYRKHRSLPNMSYTQYDQYGGNPYDNAPNTEAGYGGATGNTHLNEPIQPQTTNYSATSNYSNTGVPSAQAGHLLSQQDFLERVQFAKTQIGQLTSSISEIATLHQRALSSPDSSSSAELEALVARTQITNQQIKDTVKFLEADATKTTDGTKNVKVTQARAVRAEFENKLRDYQEEEVNYRQRYRDQIARQYRIVNPEASEDEVKEASELDWGNEGVFQTALKSNRSGQASTVLGAVRARHNELQRIEQTLTELASMFADMAQIVDAQEPAVERTEENAIKTQEDVQRANTEITKANAHARRRNRLKWWCFLVVVLIILAIGLGVGLGVGLAKAASK